MTDAPTDAHVPCPACHAPVSPSVLSCPACGATFQLRPDRREVRHHPHLHHTLHPHWSKHSAA